jgi:ankyrin repeat protein
MDAMDERGATALMDAVTRGHLEIANYLIEKGAKE